MAPVEVEACLVGELSPGEMKEVKIGSGKALLYRVGEEYFATSHLCPHYKAPLIKGVLSQDGRIMCPWHGACFDAMTGDIEDGPSVDALQKYETKIRGKSVYITADDAAITAGRRVPKAKVARKAEDVTSVVVVGGGAGGLVAVEELREAGFAGKVTLLSREPYYPIDRPKLSKALKTNVEAVQLRNKEYFDKLGVEVQLSTEVASVDAKAKSLEIKGGKKMKYDYLVVATGGDPRVIPMPGHELGNIHVVRTIADANGIDGAVTAVAAAKGADYKPKVVIVGSSFIGMEAASILAKTADVTVIGMEKVPFERVLGPDVGKAFMKLHDRAGIKFRMESVTSHYEPSAKDPKNVGAVVIKGTNERIEADLIILGVGVKCATDFLKDSGIPLERDGSIVVEESMKVAAAGVDGVFVVGDIARYPYHLTNESIRVEHWSVAQNQGRIAASNIVKTIEGKKTETTPTLTAFKAVPYFWTVQFGKSLRYAGHAESFDDVIIRATPNLDEIETLEAYYVRKNTVLAVATLAKDPVASYSSELIRLGLMPTGEEIKKGKDVMKVKLGVPPVFPRAASVPSGVNPMMIAAGVAVLAIGLGVAYTMTTKDTK